MLASLAPDLDGLSLLFGLAAYGRYHHLLAHNLLFGAIVTLVSARWVGLRPGRLALVFAAFLSHLVGDYFGSGPGWSLWPFLPFSNKFFLFEHAWDISGWQNIVITIAALAIALWVAVRDGRTPVELLSVATDQKVVDAIRHRTRF